MAPLILIFISPFKANFPHKVSAHECFDASKQLNWRVKHLEACERRFWKWNRFRDLISDTNPGAPMPDRNRRKGQNWNSTKQSCCLEMFWEIMAFVSFSANMPKKCQIQQIVTGKQRLQIFQFRDSFVRLTELMSTSRSISTTLSQETLNQKRCCDATIKLVTLVVNLSILLYLNVAFPTLTLVSNVRRSS